MKKLKLRKIEVPSYEVYQDDVLIGKITNLFEFNDLRIQVGKAKLENIYVKIDNDIIMKIAKNGDFDYQNLPYFAIFYKQFAALIPLKLDRPDIHNALQNYEDYINQKII